MIARALQCVDCGHRHPLAMLYRCARCGGVLDVEYQADQSAAVAQADREGIWRWSQVLPVDDPAARVSLGEANTALIRLPRLARELGVATLHAKAEFANPTGSFKDRPVAVAVSKALELGFARAACASTGNTGASAAAYCARAGLPYWCLVPAATPAQKLAQIAAHGARVIRVRGTYSEAYGVAEVVAEREQVANLSSTFLNPYLLEGDKTVAYELLEQLGRAPDWILVPIGAGPLLVGVLKGFEELLARGAIDRVPRLAGVQAEGCAPIAQAFEAGRDEVQEWTAEVRTVASSIADPLRGYGRHGTYTLRGIRRSNGVAVAVSDAETLWAHQRLAAEGIFAEPGSATAIAALRRLRDQHLITRDELVVALITGHGLKDPSLALAEFDPAAVPLADATPEAVAALLTPR